MRNADDFRKTIAPNVPRISRLIVQSVWNRSAHSGRGARRAKRSRTAGRFAEKFEIWIFWRAAAEKNRFRCTLFVPETGGLRCVFDPFFGVKKDIDVAQPFGEKSVIFTCVREGNFPEKRGRGQRFQHVWFFWRFLFCPIRFVLSINIYAGSFLWVFFRFDRALRWGENWWELNWAFVRFFCISYFFEDVMNTYEKFLYITKFPLLQWLECT